MGMHLTPKEQYQCPRCGQRFDSMDTKRAIEHIERSCHQDMVVVPKCDESKGEQP